LTSTVYFGSKPMGSPNMKVNVPPYFGVSGVGLADSGTVGGASVVGALVVVGAGRVP